MSGRLASKLGSKEESSDSRFGGSICKSQPVRIAQRLISVEHCDVLDCYQLPKCIDKFSENKFGIIIPLGHRFKYRV